MKLSIFVLLSFLSKSSGACRFAKSDNNAPDDEVHRNLRKRGRRLLSLRDDAETRASISNIIKKRSLENNRSLQTSTNCVSRRTYEEIFEDIVNLSQAITDVGDRGHFFGGIVRLAAHDFMDYDKNSEGSTTSKALGSDGCLDFENQANAGLPDLWCDDIVRCPLKTLYDTNYAFMSKADFWVAAANAVVKETSISSASRPDGLILPFRWGRIDEGNCEESSGRLPEAEGCSQVQATFIDRMGLTWRDAVALLGAHTLGRGDTNFSGHDGTWVDTDEESTIFDKRFYEEVVRRSWRPRQTASSGVNWTWGNQNRGVMMLNTDICLYFDIPEGNDQTCCTDTSGNCRGITDECQLARNVRPEAFSAFEEFLFAGGQNIGNNNNEPFYAAFSTAWKLATENGYSDDELFDVPETCNIVPSPNPQPISPPNPQPISPPNPQPISPPNPQPISEPSPVPPSPTVSCEDKETFKVKKKDGKIKILRCDKILQKQCQKYGHHCPVTCDLCDCAPARKACKNNEECCSGICNKKGKCSRSL